MSALANVRNIPVGAPPDGPRSAAPRRADDAAHASRLPASADAVLEAPDNAPGGDDESAEERAVAACVAHLAATVPNVATRVRLGDALRAALPTSILYLVTTPSSSSSSSGGDRRRRVYFLGHARNTRATRLEARHIPEATPRRNDARVARALGRVGACAARRGGRGRRRERRATCDPRRPAACSRAV